MSIMQNSFFGRRRSEPHRPHIWDLFQDHNFGAARTSTPPSHIAFPSDPSPIVDSHHIEWKETPEGFVCKARLPGLKRSDVRVEVDDDRVLSIICSKRVEMEEQGGGWRRVEVSSGNFVQRLMLPENCKVEHVKANMDNGVLTVTIPKHRVVNNRVRNIRISHA